MKPALYALCLMIMNMVSAHAAGDQELYDPKPPADAALVRFINMEKDTLDISGGGIASKKVAPDSASDFFVVSQGKQTFAYSGKTADMTIESGKYYTVALSDVKVTVVKDGILDHPDKAMIYFYNFTKIEGLKLFAPKQNVVIFDNVKTEAGTSREINPLALELSIRQGDKDLATLAPITLKSRTGYSIIAFGQGEGVKAVVVENAVGK